MTPQQQRNGETVAETIRRRLSELGWGWPDIDRNTDASAGTIRAIATGKRRPSLDMMRTVADIFDVDPSQWEEWRLAQARHLLDERDPPNGVGRDEALANLSRFETALRARPPHKAAN